MARKSSEVSEVAEQEIITEPADWMSDAGSEAQTVMADVPEDAGEVVVGSESPIYTDRSVRVASPERDSYPIRDLPGLNSKQKRMLLIDIMKGIVNKDITPCIPTLVHHPLDSYGFRNAYTMIQVDFRLMEDAWNAYVKNCEKPSYNEFMSIITEIKGTSVATQIFNRVGVLDLSKWA